MSLTIATLAFLSSLSYTLDISDTKVQHHWGPPSDPHAHFRYSLKAIGLTAWHESNFGLRIAKGSGETAGTKGHYSGLYIDFENVTSLELLYRHKVTKYLTAFVGLGTYWMPMPIYHVSTGELKRYDADDDEGYLMGLTYTLGPHVSVSYRYTHFSQINSEYTEGHGIHLNYKF